MIALLLLFLQTSHTAKQTDSIPGPLSMYEGKWQVTWNAAQNSTAPAKKPNLLENQCSKIGRYFACQQSVDGAPTELLVFVSLGQPGHYATQSVMPDGRAGGRGELLIEGDTWTFSGSWNSGGRTIYTRTVNLFKGRNRIHFEQSESFDRAAWTAKASGEEVRITSSSSSR